ncbi:MAG TPA: toll/interleukin-1 receptor domain-containing protein [Bryobacteraceae bacterium]|nr:toll/interleukin-1 receptor domain-containing protein [Bryobacteraceae bacterium]
MLTSDRIELAILTLIIDSHETNGRMLVLPQLMKYFEEKAGPVKVEQVVEALIVLANKNLVSVGRYRGQDFFPRQPSDGEAYFYRDFMCKALPGARRRIEELSVETKTGIFISHIGEERPAALRIKSFLETALTPAPPIFVSSDYVSIESGEEWYRAILEGLKRSLAVVALLSPQSVDRRWINFEAGFGLGQGSRVIPVVWRGLSKGAVGLPLSHFHAREITTEPEVRALFSTLASLVHAKLDETLVSGFAPEMLEIERARPNTSKPERSPADQHRYQIAEAAIEKLGPAAVKVLQHLGTVGKYVIGTYSPPPPPGLNGNQMRETLAQLVDARMVRYEITDHRIDERAYEIVPAMIPILDDLLYR